MARVRRSSIPVIDLFAGPGGLGEGFSALRGPGGQAPFRIGLSVEANPIAHETLRFRAFFRSFRDGAVPGDYYDALRGLLSPREVLDRYPDQAELADREAWNATLGATPRADVNDRIEACVADASHWVLIGGPPCQAYSLAGRSRNAGKDDYVPEEDHRQFLYVEYLQVIADHWPAVFVMENVKGLLSASLNDQRLFERILADLESPREALRREGRPLTGRRSFRYRVHSVAGSNMLDAVDVGDYVVHAERYGVPQARHRVILVGVREDLDDRPLQTLTRGCEVTVADVLDGVPKVRSGLSRGYDSPEQWLAAVRSARDSPWLRRLQRGDGAPVADYLAERLAKLRLPRHDRGAAFIDGDFAPRRESEWIIDPRLGGVAQHQTRGHRHDDLHRYLFVSAFGHVMRRSPRLHEFPRELLPAHRNVHSAINGGHFDDRFRVQVKDRPSTTVTSHIAKDGHYYIHYDPAQCRSLTMREAARLQTFPDNYYFCGNRTSGYGQIGNAVPPLLARQIAESILTLVND